MNKKITVNLAVAIAIIAMTVTFSVTMLLSMRMFDNTVSSVREKETMYNKISEIDKAVRGSYYGEINEDTLMDYLAAGYLTGTGDKYANYYTVKQYSEWQQVQSGSVAGVGMDVAKDASGYARVIRVYPASPAADVSITTDYYLLKVGDVDVKSLTADQIESLLRGDTGTNASLTVRNRMNAEEQTLNLQRRQYDMPTVFTSVMPQEPTVGYVQITSFNQRTAEELVEKVEKLTQQETPVQSLIIDVRNNKGGALTDTLDVIDAVCPVGPIASQQNKDGTTKLLDTSDNNEIALPMTVVVNAGTEGGAELFAATLRDFGKAKIVGVGTAGKGAVQCDPVALSDGSAVSFTIGILVTKNGTSFDGTGVKPDVEVLLTPDQEGAFYDLTLQNDPQIVKALEALTNQQMTSGTAGTESGAQSGAESALVPAASSVVTSQETAPAASDTAAQTESTASSDSAA